MIYQLPEEHIFPHPNYAMEDGLLAIGGDLHPKRILAAYQNGIFPWFGDNEPILWWSPNPRFVLFPDELKIAKSMRPILRKNNYTVSVNQNFENVISQCKSISRPEQNGTWITPEMKQAYITLHQMGYAHSVELWDAKGNLNGGLYGIAFGKIFCGESMFAKTSNASKIAFIYFVNFLNTQGFELIDCQMETPHLAHFGAKLIKRSVFLACVKQNSNTKSPISNWSSTFQQYFEQNRK